MIAHELGNGVVTQRSDGAVRVVEERFNERVRQIGNLTDIVVGRRREVFGGGITITQREDPAGGDVLDEQCEFGKGEREKVMELIDEARPLAHDRLEPAGDLAERALLGGEHVDRRRLLGEGVACRGAGFDGIGLLGTEEGGTIVLVALRIAAGNAERRAVRA